jgi:DnaJ-like protein
LTTRTQLIDTLDHLLDPLEEQDQLAPRDEVDEAPPSPPGPSRSDATVVVPLTSAEAAAGTRRDVRFTVLERCARCGGTGRRRKRECRRCKGAGVEEVVRRLRVQIQPGATSGMKLVIPGAGSTSPTTEHVGDLVVQIQVD